MKQATGSGLHESLRNRRHFIRNKQAITSDHHSIGRMYHMMPHIAPLETTENSGTFNRFMATVSRKTSRHGRDVGVPANVWVTTQPQWGDSLTLTYSLSFYIISHVSCHRKPACPICLKILILAVCIISLTSTLLQQTTWRT